MRGESICVGEGSSIGLTSLFPIEQRPWIIPKLEKSRISSINILFRHMQKISDKINERIKNEFILSMVVELVWDETWAT